MSPDAVKGLILGSSIAVVGLAVGFFIGQSKTVPGPPGPMGLSGPPGQDGSYLRSEND